MALKTPLPVAIPVKNDDRQEERRTNRSALTYKMVRLVLSHSAGLGVSALSAYTFLRNQSDNSNAEPALEIFDGGGNLVFQGNEFDSGIAGYWRPSGLRKAPASATEKTWG